MKLHAYIDILKGSSIADAEGSKQISQLRVIRNPTINYNHIRRRNGDWEQPEYNFGEIERYADVESYLQVSFRKKVGLFLKEGWDFVGENRENVEYINRRLAQIAKVTGISTYQLFSSIANNLVCHSNCYVGVVRNEKASGGWSYIDPLTKKEVKPIAGLFTLPTPTIEVRTNDLKQPIRYRQYMNDNITKWKEYAKEDILHFYVNKKDGFLVGTPRCLTALEDIKALRRIEENVELLVVQSLFPLIQYKVGTPENPARKLPDGSNEIDSVKFEIEGMPPEGIYVTSERHDIKMIGSEGRALRVETYLDHFKKRVLSGLGLSAVDVGEGDSSNRSTAATMSRSLIDEVKSDQKAFEEFFYNLVIYPLLMESGTDIDLDDPKNIVRLKFREIDHDTQVKKDNNTIQKWLQSAITHDELRNEMGYNSVDEEQKEALYFKMVTESAAMLSAASGGINPVTFAAANNENVPVETGDVNRSISEQHKVGAKEAKAKVVIKPPSSKTVTNRNSPSNQHGKKSSSAKSIKDTILDFDIGLYKKEMLDNRLNLNLFRAKAQTELETSLREAYRQGIRAAGASYPSIAANPLTIDSYTQLKNYSVNYVHRLFNEIDDSLANSGEEKTSLLIDSIGYRLGFIRDTEVMRAYNWGVIVGLKSQNIEEYSVYVNDDSDPNEIDAAKRIWSVREATLKSIPPWHPNSTVTLGKVNSRLS